MPGVGVHSEIHSLPFLFVTDQWAKNDFTFQMAENQKKNNIYMITWIYNMSCTLKSLHLSSH